eukprot:GHVT01102739.1.p1 GENE.GHVT01102739.1~~GHVT01102739.1.p1  ORF type:complete len:142 (+),score=0.02 GHVT01102739.1:327-752(+)
MLRDVLSATPFCATRSSFRLHSWRGALRRSTLLHLDSHRVFRFRKRLMHFRLDGRLVLFEHPASWDFPDISARRPDGTLQLDSSHSHAGQRDTVGVCGAKGRKRRFASLLHESLDSMQFHANTNDKNNITDSFLWHPHVSI